MNRWILAVAAAMVVAGCGPRPTPPGWRGSVPSPAAQGWLGDVQGKVLPEGDPDAGWRIVGFVVNEHGPNVQIRKEGKARAVPMPDDAAAAAFHERVTGMRPSGSGR